MRTFRHAFRFWIVAFLVYFGGIQGAVSGNGMDGRTLMTFCNGKFDTDFGICSGYITAISEVMLSGHAVQGYRACDHDGIRAQQLVDLIRLDIGENAAMQNQSATRMVAAILADAFPCMNDYEPASGESE